MTLDTMVSLTSDLVRISSRGGIDEYEPVIARVESWLRAHDIRSERLLEDGRVVGLRGEVHGGARGPAYMLNATVDTAPFGDPATWTQPPLSGQVVDGWLYGRGSADSKAGVAIFCHVLSALAAERLRLRGSLSFLFDAEEHSGAFGGVRQFVRDFLLPYKASGVMIGYPGHDRIIVGCRGFYRAKLVVHGVAAHSGSASRRGLNAVTRAAALVRRLEELVLPTVPDDAFDLPPQLTVTAVHGGEGFSAVPDRCEVWVDCRLTPAFTASDAEAVLSGAIESFDRTAPGAARTEVRLEQGWPAYRVADDSPVYRALSEAVQRVLGRSVPGAIAGPSSIGNYLATLGVDATSGFGVRYRNLHAADECIDLATIEPSFQVYLSAARSLLE